MGDLFQNQRAMRAMRKVAMQRGVIAVIDVGTSKVACLILRFDGAERFDEADGVSAMAGHANFRVVGAATTRSRGIKLSEINAMGEAERAIRTALQAAQKMAGVRVDHAIACFAGARPRSYGLNGEIELKGEAVASSDISDVLASCEVPNTGQDRDVLHAQPVHFALDHRAGVADPRGQQGKRLLADVHMLTVDGRAVSNLVYCLKRCDLECAGIAASSYVSAASALIEDELELGAACIDFGGGATGVSLFLRKHMIYADSVRMGGEHITGDISLGLKVPRATAERIKTFYGGLQATGMDDRERIELTSATGDWEHDRRTASRAELIGIMRPRVEEILEEVRARLDAAGFDNLPGRQIVLTGGGSQIQGLDALASKILGGQVRLGRPLRVSGLPQATNGPAFSSVVGLSLLTAKPQDEWWDFEPSTRHITNSSFKRAMVWLKENW
ncbi:MAG: cell division protein FtsA [Pseudomonadota bacterium]